MAGLPVMFGAVQDTSSCVLGVGECCHTDGAAGAAGGSFTSVTLMVTAIVSSTFVSELSSESFLSLTPTVTLYEDLAS